MYKRKMGLFYEIELDKVREAFTERESFSFLLLAAKFVNIRLFVSGFISFSEVL